MHLLLESTTNKIKETKVGERMSENSKTDKVPILNGSIQKDIKINHLEKELLNLQKKYQVLEKLHLQVVKMESKELNEFIEHELLKEKEIDNIPIEIEFKSRESSPTTQEEKKDEFKKDFFKEEYTKKDDQKKQIRGIVEIPEKSNRKKSKTIFWGFKSNDDDEDFIKDNKSPLSYSPNSSYKNSFVNKRKEVKLQGDLKKEFEEVEVEQVKAEEEEEENENEKKIDRKFTRESWNNIVVEEIKKQDEMITKKLIGTQLFSQTGISVSQDIVTRIISGIEIVLNNQNDLSNKERKFNVKDRHKKSEFSFKDYYPELFKSIRKLANISEKEYQKSICQSNMKVIITPGKSGAILFFTGDKKLLLKTVSDTELSFLNSIIKKYHQHVQQHPYTVIVRILGLYSMKTSNYHMNFIAMENAFPEKPNETYDLKGSSLGRDATEEEKKKMILKDNDFLAYKTKINLGKDLKNEFLSNLMEDCKFLTSLEIMDYSLLLGISELKEEDKFENDGKTKFTRMKSFDSKQKYYLGVIDILQKWNLKKIAELSLKSVKYDKTEISSVPPKEYSQRFYDFISNSII